MVVEVKVPLIFEHSIASVTCKQRAKHELTNSSPVDTEHTLFKIPEQNLISPANAGQGTAVVVAVTVMLAVALLALVTLVAEAAVKQKNTPTRFLIPSLGR
jgi:hypothetical protein